MLHSFNVYVQLEKRHFILQSWGVNVFNDELKKNQVNVVLGICKFHTAYMNGNAHNSFSFLLHFFARYL